MGERFEPRSFRFQRETGRRDPAVATVEDDPEEMSSVTLSLRRSTKANKAGQEI
jgi:hypothetical protein